MSAHYDSEIVQQLIEMRLELFQAADILQGSHKEEFKRMIVDIAKYCNIKIPKNE